MGLAALLPMLKQQRELKQRAQLSEHVAARLREEFAESQRAYLRRFKEFIPCTRLIVQSNKY